MNEKQDAYSTEVQEVVLEEQGQGGKDAPVKTLNRKVAYLLIGGFVVVIVSLLLFQTWSADRNLEARRASERLAAQEKPVEVDTQSAERQAKALLEATQRKQAKEQAAAAKALEVAQVSADPLAQDPVEEAQGIAAFRARTESSSESTTTATKAKDPWVAARESFRAQEAQIHYQQRLSARSAPIFGGGGAPSGGTTRQDSEDNTLQPASSQEEFQRRLAQAQRASRRDGMMMTYPSPPLEPAPSREWGELSAGDAHQEAFYHQGQQAQAGYQRGASASSSSRQADVQAGTVVHLALETGLSSELPGVVMARVTKPVYDPGLNHVVIPSGTRVLGTYNARVEKGQTRAQVLWTTLVWDGGSSFDLGGMPGVDLGGQSGLEASVDNHFDKALAGAALSGVLSASASALAGSTNQLNVDPRQQAIYGAAQPFQESGEALSKQYLDLAPTLTLEPGALVGLLVPHDLFLSN